MALPKTEAFTGTGVNPLPAGWAQVSGTAESADIFNDGARKDTVSTNLVGARWTTDTFAADQSAQITFKNFGGSGENAVSHAVFVRGSGSGATFNAYAAWRYAVDGKLYVYRCTNNLAPNVSIAGPLNTLVSGDVVKIWAVGSAIHASVNGTECAGSPWTDATISGASSSPGFLVSAYDAPSLDDWTGDVIGGDTTPPTLSARAVPSAGTTLTATLSESCTADGGGSSGTGGFTLGGTSATVSSWAIAGGTALTLTLSGTVYQGETVTLTYARSGTTDDIKDGAGNYLADFSAASVTNNSTQTTPATAYTLTAPGTPSGTAGVASGNFTLTPNGTFTGTITPSDGGGGGTFTPSSRTWSGTSDAKTFTYTPASPGVKTISATDSGSLTDPASVSYTALRYLLVDTTDSAGTAIRLLIPWNYDAAAGAYWVHYHHGAGETYTAVLADSLKAGVVDALLAAGYVVAGSTAGGENWGNQSGMDAYYRLHCYALLNYRVRGVLALSQSMGGLTGLLCLRDQRVPYKGWYGIYPVCSLADMFAANAGTYAGPIRSAHGIASDGSDYAAKTAGHDPLTYTAADFPAVGIRLTASYSDTVVSRAANGDALASLLSATAAECSVVAASGNHGDSSHFLPSDTVDFFDRCKARPGGLAAAGGSGGTVIVTGF